MTCCLCDGHGTLYQRQSYDGGDMIEVPCDRCKGSGEEPTERCVCCGKTDEDLKPHGKLFPEDLCPECWLMAEHGPDDNDLRPEDSHPMERTPIRFFLSSAVSESGELEEIDPREDERWHEAPPWMEER